MAEKVGVSDRWQGAGVIREREGEWKTKSRVRQEGRVEGGQG